VTVVRIPETLDELLTPAWLTAALAPNFPDIEVTAVVSGPVISRVSTNARFTIECAGGAPNDLSPNLCVKGYFGDVGRAYRTVGQPEAYFYRDLAASTGMRTLRCAYADIDDTTGHGVVITEDVVTQGGRFLDTRDEYTPDQVAESLGELATLHAATWARLSLRDVPWLAPRLAGILAFRGVDEIRGNFESVIGAGVPPEVRDAERLATAYRALTSLTSDDDAWTVIHGDAHLANVYLDGKARPSFVDWQLVQRGPWYLDVGYHIASTLKVEDRRRTERELVRHYLDRLAVAGDIRMSEDAAWLGIRRGIVHGFFLWGITLKVDPPITAELLERLGTAASDHEAFSAVGL
jgi:hypothetical protein